MRALSSEFTAALNEGAVRLALAWRITRRDGISMGFTDHDQPIAFDGLTFDPVGGLEQESADAHLGLTLDTFGLSGAFASDALREQDLAAGLWDGAEITAWRVDWSAPERRVEVYRGAFGSIKRAAHGFETEAVGASAKLDRAIGRVYARRCDAEVGDPRCGVALNAPVYRGVATVASIVAGEAVRVVGLDGFAAGWFEGGVLQWGAAERRRVLAHRLVVDGAVLELDRAGPPIGAAIIVTAGCDKRFETCRAKFANAVNFRGFAQMPGVDAIIAPPAPGDVHDGGRR